MGAHKSKVDSLPVCTVVYLYCQCEHYFLRKVALSESPITITPTASSMSSFQCLAPMRVMPWDILREQAQLLRSDAAAKMLRDYDPKSHVCVFISHHWWVRGEKGASVPDFSKGERAHLKYKVVLKAVAALIEKEELDPSQVMVWMDWYSIDQVDETQKKKGVASMLFYTTQAKYMLIPLATENTLKDPSDPDSECAYYPEDITEYGERGWCRVEYFIFSLWSQMQGSRYGVELYACGTDGELRQF